MKYIIGILVGVFMTFAGVAVAKNGIFQVENFNIEGHSEITKIYDENNGVVCYVLMYGTYKGGISCLK